MTDDEDDQITRAIDEHLAQGTASLSAPPIGHNSLNPKDAIGRSKAGMWCIPPTALFYEGAVMEGGAAKYGLYNWRNSPVDISVYFDALMRHIMMFRDGQLLDEESGLPHMAHVRACAGIILDAMETGAYHLEMGAPGPLARTLQILADRKRARS